MQIRTEIRLVIFVLLGLQFVTATSAIWLVERTAPAIEMILAENDYSLVAAEDMVHILAGHHTDAWPAEVYTAFGEALDRAERNITEPEEQAIIEFLREFHMKGVQSPAQIDLALNALRELVDINRKTMHEADSHAKRLAFAGAWAMVGLAMLAVVFSLLMVRRTGYRLLRPIHRLVDLARAHQSGDKFQRFEAHRVPYEFAVIGGTLNQLMDQRIRKTSAMDHQLVREERAALNALLDREMQPVWLMDSKDRVLASNKQGAGLVHDMVEMIKSDEGKLDITELTNEIRMIRLRP